jgi:hypothetical protein
MAGLIKVRKLWELAATSPLEGIFTDAQILVLHAQAFFRWCDENPRYKTEVVKHKLEWETIEIELRRPYTLSGLCMYLGVTQSYLRQTKADLLERIEAGTASHDQLQVLAAIEWIYQIVFTDQIEGAATGQYKESIIMRLNGLTDNINHVGGPDPVLRIVTRDAETTNNLNLLIANL